MLVALLLFLTGFGIRDALAMAECKCVECFNFAPFVEPVLLSGRCVFLRGCEQGACLVHGLIEARKKALEIAPAFRAETGTRSGEKLSLIFFAVLHQQFKPFTGLLLTGDQLTQLARRFVESYVGKIKQRLQIKRAVHVSSIDLDLFPASRK
jgi:hypothetical protein